MNNDLIKRIDALLSLRVESSATSTINNDCPLDPDVEKALRDCRAEIERKATYVPMTDDEWCEAIDGETRLFHGANIGFCKIVERIVIKRARGQK